jgi:hypothetical protein
MPGSRLRFILAFVILAISLALLAWSFLPGPRTILRQKIAPTEMQLPAPEGFLPFEINPLDQLIPTPTVFTWPDMLHTAG